MLQNSRWNIMKFGWKKTPAMVSHASTALPPNWEDFFPADVLKLGRECERSGAVLKCKPDAEGGGLSATVQGSEPHPYDLDVDWGTDETGRAFIDGMCDCLKV